MASLSTSPEKKTASTAIQAEYNFVEPLDNRYLCCICTSLLKVPHLTECCGHHFCASCLEKWRDSANKNDCPHCRARNFAHILDKPLQRGINELKVFCSVPSKKKGCTWEGSLSQLEAHLETCGFVEVKCENCSELIPRQDSLSHAKVCRMRKVKCDYCSIEGHFCDIFSLSHFSICLGYPVSCPNFCGTERFKRAELTLHKLTCPNEDVDCPFKEAGCSAPIKRKDLDSHMALSNQAHLLGMMEAFKKQKKEFERQKKEQSEEIEKLTMFKHTMEATMSNIRSKVNQISSLPNGCKSQLASIKQDLSVYPLLRLSAQCPSITLVIDSPLPWTSRPFYINEGYKFVLILSASNEFTLNLVPGEHDDRIEWPPKINFDVITVNIGSDVVDLSRAGCGTVLATKLSSGKQIVCKGVVPFSYKKGYYVTRVVQDGTKIKLQYSGTLKPQSLEQSLKNFSFQSKSLSTTPAVAGGRIISRARRRRPIH